MKWDFLPCLMRWPDETCAANEDAVKLALARTHKTEMKHFFQLQLNHNLVRSTVITSSITRFIVKDLQPVCF